MRNIDVLQGRFFDENDERARSKVRLVTELLAKRLERDPFCNGYVSFYGLRFTVIGVFRERVDTYGTTEVSDKR